MRIVIIGLAVLVLAAGAARAASILYATAATTGGVDGFCLRDGSIAPTPKIHVDTAGSQPRRLLVGNGMLYVAELDRIEAFPIGAAGTLKAPTSIKARANLDPRDLALAPDGKTLYATHHGYLSAYALGPDGSLPNDLTSCVQGGTTTNYLDLQVVNGLVYASADDAPGRIEVYRLNSDGSLPSARPDRAPVTGCDIAPKKGGPAAFPWPDSERTKIQKPKALVVAGDMIYVEERALHRLIAFRLQPDGTFCDKKKNRFDKNDILTEDCTGFDQLPTKQCAKKQAKKQRQQCIASSTVEVLQYEGVVLHSGGDTLIGAQFFKGRVDSYRLRPDDRLPGSPRSKLPDNPTSQSAENPAMTPVRLTTQGNVVYVAGGELDRVVAYGLDSNGVIAEQEPFSRTDEIKDSFPNDVAVAVLSAPCE